MSGGAQLKTPQYHHATQRRNTTSPNPARPSRPVGERAGKCKVINNGGYAFARRQAPDPTRPDLDISHITSEHAPFTENTRQQQEPTASRSSLRVHPRDRLVSQSASYLVNQSLVPPPSQKSSCHHIPSNTYNLLPPTLHSTLLTTSDLLPLPLHTRLHPPKYIARAVETRYLPSWPVPSSNRRPRRNESVNTRGTAPVRRHNKPRFSPLL